MSQPRDMKPLIRAFKNTTGSTIVKGTIVKGAAGDDLITPATAATDELLGVVMNDIATGTWGDVCLHGGCQILGSGVVTRFGKVTAAAAGKGAVTTTDRDRFIAIALRTGAADTLFECWVTGPGLTVSTA